VECLVAPFCPPKEGPQNPGMLRGAVEEVERFTRVQGVGMEGHTRPKGIDRKARRPLKVNACRSHAPSFAGEA